MAFILIWNFAASGFCWESTQDYFVQNIVIDPDAWGSPRWRSARGAGAVRVRERRRSIW